MEQLSWDVIGIVLPKQSKTSCLVDQAGKIAFESPPKGNWHNFTGLKLWGWGGKESSKGESFDIVHVQ